MTYEGWKEIGKNRYELVGKEYVVGYMSGEEMAQITIVPKEKRRWWEENISTLVQIGKWKNTNK